MRDQLSGTFSASDTNRIKDREPARANAFRAGGEPEGVDGIHGGVIQHLRHGLPAETMAARGSVIGEDGDLLRCLIQSGQFQAGIELLSLAVIAFKRLPVRILERSPDDFPALRVGDGNEAPGLTVAYGRGERCDLYKALQSSFGKRIGPEGPDVPAPAQQLFKPRPERLVELWCWLVLCHRPYWSSKRSISSSPR